MKKKQKEVKDEHELEIIKAVAQAWYGHSTSPSSSTSTSEFDAPRMNFKSRPSRFKLEANDIKSLSRKHTHSGNASWDFGQSLWDSYEIVSVSKKLDAALVLDHHCFDSDKAGEGEMKRKPKQGSNSLASLIGKSVIKKIQGR
ncbi:putative Mediator of RNA polymerase II transcription subunit 13 [Heracleum sosnowskyi]|uniref:Mediator of RNA polymerase II transcription subunit 13 n=1 Tax=Heracleum sosnowskyi TaxID=360622 RepID=A0AAD8H4T7_9APIA|nr:putative Mediator of RNA polymerase II transcription subunit 13 [Heracleum sosnowskyi]